MMKVIYGVIAFMLTSVPSFSMDGKDRKIFEQIEKWKVKAVREHWTFEVGYNSSLRLSEKQRFGLKMEKGWENAADWNDMEIPRTLPSSIDYREKGVVSPVKDQAKPQYCGSCWAFGTVAVVESLIAMSTGKILDLSEQQVVSCEPDYGSCGGGNYAFGLFVKKGANYEEDFPYQAKNVACKTSVPQHEKIASWGYVGNKRSRGPTVEQMKAALVKYGPIAATVSASGAWNAYKSGIYNACNSNSTNHLVAIVGYNDGDGGYWIVKNSHGTEFGEQGYIRMLYKGKNGSKCNNIGATAAYAVYNPTKN